MSDYETSPDQMTPYQHSVQEVQGRIDDIWRDQPYGDLAETELSTASVFGNIYAIEIMVVERGSNFLAIARYCKPAHQVVADVVIEGSYIPPAMGGGVGVKAYIVVDRELYGFSPHGFADKEEMTESVGYAVNTLYKNNQKSPNELQSEYVGELMRQDELKMQMLQNAFRFARYPLSKNVSILKDVRGIKISEADIQNAQVMFDNYVSERFDPKVEMFDFEPGAMLTPRLIGSHFLAKVLDKSYSS